MLYYVTTPEIPQIPEDVKVIFCDTETTGTDFLNDRLLLFQLYTGSDVYIYDFSKIDYSFLKDLVGFINQRGFLTIFHNAKFDLKFIYRFSKTWIKNVWDTMYVEVILNAGRGSSFYSLEDLANQVGIRLDKSVRKEFSSDDFTVTEKILQYSAEDVIALKPIYDKQQERIPNEKVRGVISLEMELVPVVAEMEYIGVKLSKEKWRELYQSAEDKLTVSVETIKNQLFERLPKYSNAYQMAEDLGIPLKTKDAKNVARFLNTPETIKKWFDKNFNVGSHVQLKSALNKLGFSVESTDVKVLKKLGTDPIIDELIQRSELAKRISTYGEDFLKHIKTDGRVHTEYLNVGAASGRFSSSNPNLQNIPTAPGYRESFIPEDDFVWVSADYSQQEYRLTGGVSKEPKIIEAYLAGLDMHTATAAVIYHKHPSEVTKAERSVGKGVNFSLLYGSTEWGLSRNLNISVEEAKEIIEKFRSGYPILMAFKDEVEKQILKLLYSATVLGRRRYFEKPMFFADSREFYKWESSVRREGFNHIIQGSGADVIKIAMVNIHRKNPFGDKLRILLQVHDELDFEVHKSVVEGAKEFIKQEMLAAEQPFLGELPAAVDVKVADCWVH
jgi:DNA polymerase-1